MFPRGETPERVQEQMSALSKAISEFRKGKVDKDLGGRPIDTFIDKAEEIFGTHILEKDIGKIEDVMSMPTHRGSRYFSEKGVTHAYSPKGDLIKLHNAYKNKPTLDNYDSLQSALKKELREMEGRAKISDTAQPKVDQLKENINNLNSDKEKFMKTLPKNMQNLENEFRSKYKDYARTYEKGKKETGASLTLRRLAEGRHELVSDADVIRLFSHPTKSDKKAILEMGASGARNAIYAALQKVPVGDAEKMAHTILDLKRTKGFDEIITPEFEKLALDALRRSKISQLVRGSSKTFGGAAVGGLLGGPVGAVVGGALPFGWKGAKFIAEKLRK
jgi:hypothetical protein